MVRRSRRTFLKTTIGALAVPSAVVAARTRISPGQPQPQRRARPRIVVVGAGAFGGWTALHLVRRGAQVMLLDAWGPGNARASSGGETRVIRGVYGPSKVYVEMAARALTLWQEHDRKWNSGFYRRTGALWMFGKDDSYARASMPFLREAHLAYHELTPAEAHTRYPQIDFAGVELVVEEEEAGYLLARRACERVLQAVVAEGGEYRQAAVKIPEDPVGALERLALSDGDTVTADMYVFACGPWLGTLFPRAVGARVAPTRQEVFYFGPSAGDRQFVEGALPVWVDYGPRLMYGIPGNANRGFKVADDTHGPPFDPTSGERAPSAAALQDARDLLARRFPALRDAPLLGAEVCQYENSPDGHFILDRHPGAANVWIAGGGSGHGFKMGPALGERLARMVLDEMPVDPFFSLGRFKA